MKTFRLISFLTVSLLYSTFALADAVTLQSLVDSFNSANSGAGVNVLYTSGSSDSSAVGRTGQHAIGFSQTDAAGYLGAYLSPFEWNGTWQDQYAHVGNLRDASYQGNSMLFANSFCVEVGSRTIENTYVNAKLNLVDNGDGTYRTMVDGTGVYGSAMSDAHALTLGSALMYQAWLTGDLDRDIWNQVGVKEGWREDPSKITRFGEYDIQAAIWAFQGDSVYDNYTGTGSTEGYREHAVAFLEAIYGDLFGGQDEWWLQAYDPVNHSVDGYSVLVVNMMADDGKYENGFQDHIILVPNKPATTPEPASMLIFGFGLASVYGLRRRPRKTA